MRLQFPFSSPDGGGRRRASRVSGLARRNPAITTLTAGIVGFVGVTGSVAAFGTTTGTGATLPATTPVITKFTEQLTVPQRIDLTAGGSTTLNEVSGNHQFHSNLGAAPSWGYVQNGTNPSDVYGGPTLEVSRGKPVNVTVNNKLSSYPTADAIDHQLMGSMTNDEASSPRTAMHLHGAHDAAADDGGPEDTFLPGQSHTYHYINDQQATGLWYHDHSMSTTRLSVVNGLSGNYWIRDASDTGKAGNPEGLPTGNYELPLELQDRAFNPDGSVNYMNGAPGAYTSNWIPEYFGDTATVNGKAFPNLNVDRGLYRFRLLNGSNARFYDLSLVNANGAQLYQIGQGGGLLNKPVPVQDLLIAPGDRADVLIDFSKATAGTKIVLNNAAKAPYPSGPRSAKQGGVNLPDIMQFTVGSKAGFTGVPATLRGGKGQPAAIPAAPPTPSKVRNVYLNEILDPTTGDSQRVLLNNLPFDSYKNGQLETGKAGTVEQWNIINTTGDAHPLHLHLVQFRVLGRQSFNVTNYTNLLNQSLPGPGLPDPASAEKGPWPAPSADQFAQGNNVAPAAQESGWQDVVVAPPGQITRIVVAYGGTDAGVASAPYTTTLSDPTGAAYVWHCHILEHEDNDMMQQMRVN